MVPTPFLISSTLVLASMLITGNQATHHELCVGKLVNFTEIEFIALGECVKEFSPAPALDNGATEAPEHIKERITKAKDNKCMEPCFMEHKKMFVDGIYNEPNCLKFIEEFPMEVRQSLTDSLKKCAEPIIGKKLTRNNDCADFATFVKCVDDDEDKICKRD